MKTYEDSSTGQRNWKYKIEIFLKKRDRVIYLYTNDNSFNATNTFTSRRSISVPAEIDGIGEEYYENGGGLFESWKDLDYKLGESLNSQLIDDVHINEVSINAPFIKLAKKYNCELKFPLLYHFQIFLKNSAWVYNWYPTTGSTIKQNLSVKYSIEKVGYFNDFEELLNYIKDSE